MKIKGMCAAWMVAILVLVNFSSALTVEMKKEFDRGETMLVKIYGNILEPIKDSQVKFYRGHVLVPFEYGVVRVGENYYVWAVAPINSTQNYTFGLDDVSTTINGLATKLDYSNNFSVGSNLTTYTIRPGAVNTRKDFDVAVDLYQDDDRIISTDFPNLHDVRLKPGKNIISFPISSVRGEKIYTIRLGAYNLPAYVLGNNTQIVRPDYLTIEPLRIYRVHRDYENNIRYFVNITNGGEEDLNNLTFRYNRDLFKIEPEIKQLLSEEDVVLNITIKRHTLEPIDEEIYIQSGSSDISIELPLSIRFIENRTIQNTTNVTNETAGNYYCVELNGAVCSANQACVGSEKIALDGACCIGACTELERESGDLRWVGWLIGSLVIVALGFLYFKYKKAPLNKNPLEGKIALAEKAKAHP